MSSGSNFGRIIQDQALCQDQIIKINSVILVTRWVVLNFFA